MSEEPWPPTVSLEGEHAALVPLSQDHAADLADASAQGGLHELWYTPVPAPKDIPAEIDRRLGLRKTGMMLPFAVIDRGNQRAVGMTTYMNVSGPNRRVEIGHTWYAKSVQRTAINTECKILLLTHAFEVLDCVVVEFRTHFMNFQSRAAIERLGAKLDGILRAQKIMADGSLRDTAAYSIIAPEWLAAKANLTFRLRARR
ncbi:MAG: GNAT family protein [Pseudomonadota bacterium]